jgi:hypothetical protein
MKRTNIVWLHLNEVVRSIKTWKRMVTARAGGRGNGSYYLMGTESLFGKIKQFWRWMMVRLYNHVDVLDTKLCTSK